MMGRSARLHQTKVEVAAHVRPQSLTAALVIHLPIGVRRDQPELVVPKALAFALIALGPAHERSGGPTNNLPIDSVIVRSRPGRGAPSRIDFLQIDADVQVQALVAPGGLIRNEEHGIVRSPIATGWISYGHGWSPSMDDDSHDYP